MASVRVEAMHELINEFCVQIAEAAAVIEAEIALLQADVKRLGGGADQQHSPGDGTD